MTFTAPSFDANTGTFLVRGTFENPDGVMKPYQYVTALVSGFTRPNAIVVPQRLSTNRRPSFCLGDRQGQQIANPSVEVGEWQGTGWIISKGISAGDKVVVDGLIMRPNTPLDPKPATAEDAATTDGRATDAVRLFRPNGRSFRPLSHSSSS